MVQDKIFPIDVAFLTYDPKKCSDTPLVKQDSSCVIGYEELKRHKEMKRKEKYKMGPDAYNHYKWYNSMLAHELKTNPEATKIKIIHWHIESGNTEAFMMNGKLYKNVSIIIGEMEHWYCANVGKNGCFSYGSRYRKRSPKEDEMTQKLAIFMIDDNEAHFVVKDDNPSKCTIDVCANNCIECKKFRSPFSNKQVECACYPSKKDFKSIVESDEDYESDDEADEVEIFEKPKKSMQQRKGLFGGKFKLNAICEE